MSDFVVVPSESSEEVAAKEIANGHAPAPADQYIVTLDDLLLFADAACELGYLNGFVDPDDTEAHPRAAVVLVEKLHAAIERIAGPDAGVIYGPNVGAPAEQS